MAGATTFGAVSAEVVLLRIREVLAREVCAAWGVCKVCAMLRREGVEVSRKRVHAIMRAHGLVLARDRELGESPRGHAVVPAPHRSLATDLTIVWTRRDGGIVRSEQRSRSSSSRLT